MTADSQLPFIDLRSQYLRIKSEIDARIARVMSHGQFVAGPEVDELEFHLTERVGRECIAVGSGTDALVIALMALGIGSGDEVITSAFSFAASAEAIALLGATPVFVDIDTATYNLDPLRIESAISPRTRAILAVSLYGQCAAFDAINEIASRYQLPVIEDGAQSFGATYRGRPSCGLTTIGCTSFFPSKPLGAYGEGGACFSEDSGLAKVMREIRVHGQDRRYHHVRLGFNSRLDTIQAAILLAKLTVFDDEIRDRERIASRYSALLHGMAAVRLPQVVAGCTSVYAQFTIEVPHRDGVIHAMATRGIPAIVHYPSALHRQPVFSTSVRDVSCPNAEHAARHVLSLPMHAYLSQPDQDRVVSALRDAIHSA